MPRARGVGGTRAVPDWLRKRGYLIAVAGFFGIAGARLAGLDRNGAAMGTVLVAVVVTAVMGGLVFKGNSGWCSSICALLLLQRGYGQTPFVTVPNSHCTSCVGCAKNCYDFKPRAAWQADIADPDEGWRGPAQAVRRCAAGFRDRLLHSPVADERRGDTAVCGARAGDVGQRWFVLRDRCHVAPKPVDADGGVRSGGAQRVLLVRGTSARRCAHGAHRRQRGVAALGSSRSRSRS
jgi:hypothetical protein